MGGKEGYTVLIRDPKAPVVTDEEFVRLAESGHVAGVEAFTTAPDNKGRVDVPRSLVAAASAAMVHSAALKAATATEGATSVGRACKVATTASTTSRQTAGVALLWA